jgi:hypothetical protein
MAKGTTMSRRQRRQDLRRANMLKVKNMFSRFSPQRMAWYSKMAEDGATAHEAHVKRVEDSIGDQLELRLKGNYDEETSKGFHGLRNTWAAQGYNEAEVSMLEEAWSLTVIKDKETYKEDKKKSRDLMKKAAASRAKRS